MVTPIHLGPDMTRQNQPSEGRIQDEIRLALGREPDLILFRNNVSTAMMPNGQYVAFGVGGKGASDLVGAFRGRAVFVEVKRPGQSLRPEQVTFRRLVESKGCIYVVLHSAEEAVQWIARLKEND